MIAPTTKRYTRKEPYLPSPEEIREECQKIRYQWDESDYAKRLINPVNDLHAELVPREYEFPLFTGA